MYSPHAGCGYSDCLSSWFVFDEIALNGKIEMSCIKCRYKYYVHKGFGIKIAAQDKMEGFIRWANT